MAKPPAPSKKKSLGYYNKANPTGTGGAAGGGMSQKGVNKYKKDTKKAKKIAKKGRDFYLKYFNSTIVSDYMLSKLFDYKSSNNFIWSK